MRARCWSCEEEVAEAAIAFEARLVPRTASRGGPLTLVRCAGCGALNLVERNPAGEVFLSPPLVRGYAPPELRGADLARARLVASGRALERATFLARRPRPVAPAIEHAATPAPETEPPPSSEEAPEPPASRVPAEVTGLLDAYAVLGLPLTATFAEVKGRYRSLSLRCHPDRVADLDEEIRNVAERKFRRLRAAFDLIARECPPERPDSR
jgi:DnaJ-domain-containing protein 1